MSEVDLHTCFKEIIKNDYHKHFSDWLFGARQEEKKGLYLLGKIMKHQGKKVFTDYNVLKPEVDINEMNMISAYARYKKKSENTTYKTDFVSSKKDLYKNVFQVRDIAETQYNDLLSEYGVQYIRNWLTIETCELYKDMVLSFLRSFYSTVKSNKSAFSIYRKDYNPYKKHENFSKDAFFMEQKTYRRDHSISVEEMRKILKIDELKEKMSKIPKIEFNNQIENNKFLQEKKQELIRGKKNLIKGIYGSTTTSIYQESFKGHPEKYKFYFKPDLFTSGVKGKIPDPSTMLRNERNLTINDNLKEKVNNIIHSQNY